MIVILIQCLEGGTIIEMNDGNFGSYELTVISAYFSGVGVSVGVDSSVNSLLCVAATVL